LDCEDKLTTKTSRNVLATIWSNSSTKAVCDSQDERKGPRERYTMRVQQSKLLTAFKPFTLKYVEAI
jgi:hypothetical protein